MKKSKVDLGAGLIQLQLPLAVGTLQWGTTAIDNKIINSKGCITESEALAIVSEFCNAGVTLFDTAEGYGGGTSEKRLGRCVATWLGKAEGDGGGDDVKPLLMTKFLPVPWRLFQSSFERALRASNRRMGVECCPVYLIHSPVHWRPLEFWVEAAAICKEKGLLTALGLSNCNADQVRRAVAAGNKFGVPVICNQVHYSLLDYGSEALQNMEATCKELGVVIVAYSPIGQGLLTDGLSPELFASNKPAKMFRVGWEDIQPLRAAIRRIADVHGCTMAQVALNWCCAHDTVPLVGCRSVKQARDTLGCIGWDLSEEEVKELDQLSLSRSTLESPGWRRAIFVSLAGIVMMVCRGMDWLGLGMIEQAKS